MFFFSTSYLLHGHGDAMMVLMVVADEVAIAVLLRPPIL
jgi:hypothetical protein